MYYFHNAIKLMMFWNVLWPRSVRLHFFKLKCSVERKGYLSHLLTMTSESPVKIFSNKSVSSTERIFFDEVFKTFRLYPGS